MLGDSRRFQSKRLIPRRRSETWQPKCRQLVRLKHVSTTFSKALSGAFRWKLNQEVREEKKKKNEAAELKQSPFETLWKFPRRELERTTERTSKTWITRSNSAYWTIGEFLRMTKKSGSSRQKGIVVGYYLSTRDERVKSIKRLCPPPAQWIELRKPGDTWQETQFSHFHIFYKYILIPKNVHQSRKWKNVIIIFS